MNGGSAQIDADSGRVPAGVCVCVCLLVINHRASQLAWKRSRADSLYLCMCVCGCVCVCEGGRGGKRGSQVTVCFCHSNLAALPFQLQTHIIVSVSAPDRQEAEPVDAARAE